MASPKPPKLGATLRRARESIRFAQSDFADEIGVSRRTLFRWETDVTEPGAQERERLVTGFLRFDRVVGERMAIELGVTHPPAQLTATLNQGIADAATSLGVSPQSLTTAVAKLVREWRLHGATTEELARWLGV